MPDGRSIVFTADRVADAEYRWRQGDIYKVDVASGQITQLTNQMMGGGMMGGRGGKRG